MVWIGCILIEVFFLLLGMAALISFKYWPKECFLTKSKGWSNLKGSWSPYWEIKNSFRVPQTSYFMHQLQNTAALDGTLLAFTWIVHDLLSVLYLFNGPFVVQYKRFMVHCCKPTIGWNSAIEFWPVVEPRILLVNRLLVQQA